MLVIVVKVNMPTFGFNEKSMVSHYGVTIFDFIVIAVTLLGA
jgi:hypothetical protein